jgi:hypothetical protein
MEAPVITCDNRFLSNQLLAAGKDCGALAWSALPFTVSSTCWISNFTQEYCTFGLETSFTKLHIVFLFLHQIFKVKLFDKWYVCLWKNLFISK